MIDSVEKVFSPADMSPEKISIEQSLSKALRKAGLVDRRSACIEMKGKDRLDLLHRLSTNDLVSRKPGAVIATSFLNEKGKMIDQVQILIRDQSLFAVPSPENETGFSKWVEKFIIMEDVALRSLSSEFAHLSLIGPRAVAIAAAALGGEIPPGMFIESRVEFGTFIAFSPPQYGDWFVDIFVRTSDTESLRNHLCEAGKETPELIDSPTYDTLRISRGIPTYGSEISDRFTPFEVGLDDSISFTKGCYVGQEVIARLDTYKKVRRQLMGVLLPAKPDHPQARLVMPQDKKEVGVLTSVSSMQVGGKHVGLAVARRDDVRAGDRILVGAESAWIEAQAVELPIQLHDIS